MGDNGPRREWWVSTGGGGPKGPGCLVYLFWVFVLIVSAIVLAWVFSGGQL